MSPVLALRDILRVRNDEVAFGVKRTSMGEPGWVAQSRSERPLGAENSALQRAPDLMLANPLCCAEPPAQSNTRRTKTMTADT